VVGAAIETLKGMPDEAMETDYDALAGMCIAPISGTTPSMHKLSKDIMDIKLFVPKRTIKQRCAKWNCS